MEMAAKPATCEFGNSQGRRNRLHLNVTCLQGKCKSKTMHNPSPSSTSTDSINIAVRKRLIEALNLFLWRTRNPRIVYATLKSSCQANSCCILIGHKIARKKQSMVAMVHIISGSSNVLRMCLAVGYRFGVPHTETDMLQCH